MKYLILTGILFFTDFFTKNRIERNMHPDLPEKFKPALSKHLGITKVHNEGFMLHKLDSRKNLVKGISGACAAIFLIFAGHTFFAKEERQFDTLSKTGLAFLAAGALGNTYDRFCRGFVIDFIRIKTFGKKFSRLVFNLADFFLFAGTAIFSLSLLYGRKR